MFKKGEHIIKYRKLGKEVNSELKKIVDQTHIRKLDKKMFENVKEQILFSARYDYELPHFMIWNEVELKLQL
jgi:hypothetical protein